MKDSEIYGKDTNETLRPLRLGTDGNIQATGDVAHDGVDSGRPVKIGGVARQSNPTAVADADRVSAIFDDLGRQVMVLHQVRDLIATARATVSTGAETTLLSGSPGVFHDLIEFTCSNSSSVAQNVALRDATGGGILKSFDIAANQSLTHGFMVPIPQNTAAAAWTIQNTGSGEISGTTIEISATFIKNV